MRKVSPKTVWYALTSVCIVMVLGMGACAKPVDIGSFLEDETVQEIIESTKVAVKVDNKTGDDLKGLDRGIKGLKNDKYYMVEKEMDADGVLVAGYPKYVTDNHPTAKPYVPGALWGELGYITKITGGNINGLINFHTYTVRSAEPFIKSGNLSYTDGSSDKVSKTVTNGVINISGIDGKGYLDLSSVLTGEYEVIAVFSVNLPNPPDPTKPPSSPWDWDSKTDTSWGSFELEGPNTEIDYVFVKTDDPSDFKFLKVKIGPSVTSVEVALTIGWGDDEGVDEEPTLTPAEYTFSQPTYYSGTPLSVTINVLNVDGYTIEGWQYDGKSTSLGTAPSITLSSIDEVDYLALGTHTITLVCTKGGKPYSADFAFTVTP